MSGRLLPPRRVAELVQRRGGAVSEAAMSAAGPIVRDVAARGETALREYAERFNEIKEGASLFFDRAALVRALQHMAATDRERLKRIGDRIRSFAEAQLRALAPVDVAVPGGRAGHWIAPVERAGCYAPGGRYPLLSSALMTVVTARTAGVKQVWLATPRPGPMMLGAAALAGADGVLAAGGAHAIAALAFGAGPVPPSDVIAGPGNRYVSAAKQIVSTQVRIDMRAGPTEVVIFADQSASASAVAADLLAQAEHDPDARPILVTLDRGLAERVELELGRQLATLPTAAVAHQSLANGGVVLVNSVEEGIAACDALAPEHLELFLEDATAIAPRLNHFGALFIGGASAEVLGDYGAGPNHVLPTAGTARATGGLSVFTFLRVRTWLRIDDGAAARPLIEDAAWLGRVEGLEAHARSAEQRLD
ncbi:MAG TPA: histidinol dehydrogenase [Gemmatimonadales bacterium]|nr:histidinol dehydrogenase [Gemmatimonadales bacterium]